MFRGEYSLTIDSKARVAVPARYRDRLTESSGGKLVITISLMERCLVVYPFPEWQRIEADLEKLPALDSQAQTISHLLIGHANECDMDGHGRVLLPQSLREFANLDRHAKMIGLVRKFELWEEQRWAERRDQYLGQIGELKTEPAGPLRDLVL